MNQKHLKFICAMLELGMPIGDVSSVYGCRGGSFMWRVSAEKANYAIKQLAPVIDLKSEKILTKYELSEKIAYRFSQQEIQAVSAIQKSGKRLILIDNTGYLVYPWVEGYTLGRGEVSEIHAIKIAEVIAKLHRINLIVPEIADPRVDIHTNESIIKAIARAASCRCSFAKMLIENQQHILSLNNAYQNIIPLLLEDTLVTHGDLDQLNILWDKNDQPILIDWESARKLNPTREIVRASLDWSGISTEYFSSIYISMLETYIKSGGSLNINHVNAALHSLFGSTINWMLYNIELACTSVVQEERDTAAKEINGALNSMMRLKILIPDLVAISIKINPY